MGNYCSEDDLLALISATELKELTAESGEEPDAAVVAQGIAQAESEIDSYLAVRYQLPLAAPVPDLVKSLAVDLALYHLYSRRSVAPATRRQKYEDALAFLKLVASGRAVIIGAAGTEEPGAVQDVTEVSSSERVFSRKELEDW